MGMLDIFKRAETRRAESLAERRKSLNRLSQNAHKRMFSVIAPLERIIGGDVTGENRRRVARYLTSGGVSATNLVEFQQEVRRSPYLRAYLGLAKNGVVGQTGIHPTLSRVEDDTARDIIREKWGEFIQEAVAEGSRISLNHVLRGAVENRFTDGRMFFIIRYHEDYPQGIALQPMSLTSLAFVGQQMTNEQGDELTVGGITIRRKSGRVVAYNFFDTAYDFGANALDRIGFVSGGVTSGRFGHAGTHVRVPAGLVLDYGERDRATDYGSFPSRLLAGIFGLADVLDVQDSAQAVMRRASERVGVFTKTADAESTTPIDENDPDLAGLSDDEKEEIINAAMAKAATRELKHGGIAELPKEWDYKPMAPGWPNIDTIKTNDAALMIAASALGTDLYSLRGDASGVNYSALRHFAIQQREHFRQEQELMRDQIVAPFFRAGVDHMRLFDEDFRGLPAEVLLQAKATTFEARSYEWVDPAKEAQANMVAMSLLGKSPQDIAREKGRDIRDVIRDFAEIGRIAKQMGEDFQAGFDLVTGETGDAPAGGGASETDPEKT